MDRLRLDSYRSPLAAMLSQSPTANEVHRSLTRVVTQRKFTRIHDAWCCITLFNDHTYMFKFYPPSASVVVPMVLVARETIAYGASSTAQQQCM